MHPSSPPTHRVARPVSPSPQGVSPVTSTGAGSCPGGAERRMGGPAEGESVARLRVGSCFSGAGMLDVAVHQALGGAPAWFVESDPAASKALTHHWPDVPNHGDITTVDWAAVAQVDVLTMGFPCQDVSSAGRRLGLRPGTRSGLWAHGAYAISQLQPGLVVIENVRGLLSADAHCDLEPCPWCVGDGEGRPLRALGCVLGDLADLGYDARWCGIRAADVGAPHGRFRVFIIAWSASDSIGGGRDGWTRTQIWEAVGRAASQRDCQAVEGSAAPHSDRLGSIRRGGSWDRWSGSPDHDQSAAHPEGIGWGEGWPEPAGQFRRPHAAVSGDTTPADPNGSGCRTGIRLGGSTGPAVERNDPPLDWGPYEPAIRRWELILGRSAPAPTQVGKRSGHQLSPTFVEWMMGWPQGWVTGVPELSRNDQLKILGNGVVPQQAIVALARLLPAVRERAA